MHIPRPREGSSTHRHADFLIPDRDERLVELGAALAGVQALLTSGADTHEALVLLGARTGDKQRSVIVLASTLNGPPNRARVETSAVRDPAHALWVGEEHLVLPDVNCLVRECDGCF